MQKVFKAEDLDNFHRPLEQCHEVPVPFPFLNDDGNKIYIRDRFLRKPPKDGIIPQDRHMVVTEFSLDHWLAQTFKMNIDQIPTVRPSHIPKQVYEQLRKYVKYGQNYDSAASQQPKKSLKGEQSENNNNVSKGALTSLSEAKNQQQNIQKKPFKERYIVYPKSMKLVPFVDQLEQQLALEKPEKVKDNNYDSYDDIRVIEEEILMNNDNNIAPPMLQGNSPQSRSQSKNKIQLQRSKTRNAKTSQTQALNQKFTQRLPNFERYSRPNRDIRHRINSEKLNFLNPQEIEKSATQYEQYLKQMKSLSQSLQTNSQQALPKPIIQSTTIEATRPLSIDKNQMQNRRLNMRRQSQKHNETGSQTKQSILQGSLKGHHANALSMRNIRNSSNYVTQATSAGNNIFSKQSQVMASPYQNMQNSSISQKGFSRILSTSPRGEEQSTLVSPRSSIYQNQMRTSQIMQFHHPLDKAKTITLKSKLTVFKDDREASIQNQRAEKLANIVNRNMISHNSSAILEKENHIQSAVSLPSEQVMIGSSRPSQIYNKRLVASMVRIETQTTFDNVIIDEKSSQNHEGTVSGAQKDEIQEDKNAQKDEISVNMLSITMDFNELQKRFNDMNTPEFWLQKAIQKQRNESSTGIEGGIDYYKQGLRINPQSEKLLYNIACSYEKIGKYENSILWFKHVLEVAPKWADPHYGLALTHFKLKKYKESTQSIEKAIEFHNEKSLIPYDHAIYFRAMCYKKTGEQTLCQKDYQSLRRKFHRNMNHDMVKYVFGILLLPLQEDRQLINNFVENYNELMIFYSQKPLEDINQKMFISQFCITKKVAQPYKFNFTQYKHYIFYFLHRKSFFRRFEKLQEFSKEIEVATVCRYEKDEIILLPSEDTVGVVLFGTIFALTHGNQSQMKPRIVLKCIEGNIIGHPEVDNGITSHSETWLIAYEPCEVIFFKREHFTRMWESQRMYTEKQIILCSLQRNLFFHFMSQQMKYLLIYEKLTEKFYEPGETVVLQAKRSFMNNMYKQYYENRTTKIRQEIENKKMTHEMNTGKKHSEIGSLMDVMRENNRIRKINKQLGKGVIGQLIEKHVMNVNKIKLKGIMPQSKKQDDDDESLATDMDKDFRADIGFTGFQEQNTLKIVLSPEEDEDDYMQPYCKGVYIVQSGSINVVYNEETSFTLKNGDSFGESVIIKQPSYEYFGNLVAGPNGARCFMFSYDVLRTIPFQSINDIIEIAGFQRKKESLIHVLSQKYGYDINNVLKY